MAVGVPADLLRRRPDVRTAERQLAAQTAQIGVAKAQLYPNFSLAGTLGLESLEYANLYSASARAAQGLAKAAWTLFDGGSIRQNIKLQTAKQEESLSFYEKHCPDRPQRRRKRLGGLRQRADAPRLARRGGDGRPKRF